MRIVHFQLMYKLYKIIGHPINGYIHFKQNSFDSVCKSCISLLDILSYICNYYHPIHDYIYIWARLNHKWHRMQSGLSYMIDLFRFFHHIILSICICAISFCKIYFTQRKLLSFIGLLVIYWFGWLNINNVLREHVCCIT